MAAIRKFDPAAVSVQEYRLPAEKRLSGDPLQRLWNHYTDASGKFSAGAWSSEVGKWRIAYTEEEYCRIQQGISVITDDSGHALTVAAGDEFVIPRGFAGTWEVIEPTRKIYVIYEAGV